MNESMTEWKAVVTDDDQPKLPVRIGSALVIGVILWLGGYLGINAVLLPAKVVVLDAANKTNIIAVLATSGMIVATFANIIFGAASDLTRSRWGRRTPWIVVGSVASALSLVVVMKATSVAVLVVSWCVYQFFLNAIVAPLIAVLADRVAPRHRGTLTAFYAFGSAIGQYGGQLVAAQFLDKVDLGFIVLIVATLLSGPVAAVLLREPSSLNMPKQAFTKDMILSHFSLPMHGARDYYLALFGKFMMQSACYAVSGYQLYILTDYMNQDSASTSRYVSIVSMCMMVSALVVSLIAGPISDKIGRRKPPVIVASMLIAIGVFVPFVSNEPWTIVVYAVIAGIGVGAYNSVDQALNVEVLPDPATAAKDLGILNLANTGGQILGPVIAAMVINAVGYHLIFPIAAIIAIIGAVLIGLIRSVK
ncbi:MFS transporter [Bifidobacterium simiarum]|uniref:MFS transporter n=1 Tax=Bifidobacterium simiarum TaxID=2045441 RepID=UPI001BDDC176|nr:MFS transporter [Bifidobacterium simiarum]MBT1165755.1 MFS transporter [Bifidobacterium simiarum]